MAFRALSFEGRVEAEKALGEIGVDPAGIEAMLPKMFHLNIALPRVECRAANILKQEMLSLGGDAAVARETVACTIPHTDVILMGTEKQLRRAVLKFRRQPFGIREIAGRIETLLDATAKGSFAIPHAKGLLTLGEETRIMGILNVTPDSFSDGGRHLSPDRALESALRMVEEGAHIIDVGGESTRPGAAPVPLEEEIGRVIPVIERIAARVDVPISVDTYKAEVARRAVDAGAAIINDISGLRFDPGMAEVSARSGAPLILMHIRGTPRDMQVEPHYGFLMGEIIGQLEEAIGTALKAGVNRDRIIVDPGIGFGKRLEDNLTILRRLDELRILGCPILVGPSRKSFIGTLLDNAGPEERLEGTLAACVLARTRGAHILRVHDVKETARATRIADAILKID